MARFRRRSAISAASTAISAAAFWLAAMTHMARADDLRGYSIDATYTTQTLAGAVIVGDMPRLGLVPVQHHDRIYISVLGNVFFYSDSFGGTATSHGTGETQLDKARPLSHGRMRAWTIEQNRLVKIEHVIEGNLVGTFTIDPGRSTCTVSYYPDPDPKTGRTVMQLLGGQTMEIKAYDVRSSTCTVRKGNIFAADQ